MLNYRCSSSFLLVLCAVFIFSFSSCKKEVVPEEFLPTNDHNDYLSALQKLELDQTALGSEWIKSAEKALINPLKIESPFAENFYFDPSEVNYLSYLISVKRGQHVDINISVDSKEEIKTFLDVYRLVDGNEGSYAKVASNNEIDSPLTFEVKKDGDYAIRFQTELLRGGNFKIHIQVAPSLAFPVSGKDNSAIGSLFGVPRDGGRRKHHGIDIFAKRHTPIIAPTDGYVRFAGEKGLGGTVIWMKDEIRDQTLYFAHLQELYVADGEQINIGDTIGTVGNSGNARTTPPHLHFGIYQNGPVDPYPFVAKTRTRLRRELVSNDLIGETMRTRSDAKFKVNGITKYADSKKLDKHQILEVVGAAASYYRVKLPNNEIGYIDYKNVELADKPINKINTSSTIPLLSYPKVGAIKKHYLNIGEEIKVLGSNNDYQLVENVNGIKGWMKRL